MNSANKNIYIILSYASILLMSLFFVLILYYTAKLGDRNYISSILIILSALNVVPFVVSLMFIAFQYPRIPSKFGIWYQRNLILGTISMASVAFVITFTIIRIIE